jgi:hypothetical protein
MNKKIKTSYKAALVAGAVAAVVSSSQAQAILNNNPYALGDAVAGFTVGVGNDLIVDLGPVTSLVNGETWNLSGLLTGNLSLASPGGTFGGVVWGVVGVSADPNMVYANVPSGATMALNSFGSQAAFNQIKGAVANIGGNISATGQAIGTPAASSDFSWNLQATADSTSGTSFSADYGNPGDTTVPSQDDVTEFWSVAQGGSGAQTQLLNFTLQATGILMYGSASPAQPTLTITSSAGNVILTWPSSATGYTLQSNANLSLTANWNTVSPAPTVINGTNTVMNAITGAQLFYRLSQ